MSGARPGSCWRPNALLLPDEQAVVEILKLVDGASHDSAGSLTIVAGQFDAPRAEIAEDVLAMLRDLHGQEGVAAMIGVDPPLALLAELTHRCPLGCPYCSNPLALERSSAELDYRERGLGS